jgi:hypothetical protein
MRRPRSADPKTERVNMCLTVTLRNELERIAEREDRDLGYLATWFVEWGIQQYQTLDASLVELQTTRVVRDKVIHKRAEKRLVLREEAARQHEKLRGSSPERKRA